MSRAKGARARPSGARLVAAATAVALAAALSVYVALRAPARSDAPRPSGAAATSRPPGTGDLLDAGQVARLGGAGWSVVRTDANTSGDGLNSVCQQRRFADPSGSAALVRVLRTADPGRRSVVQTVEVSRSPTAAATAYRTTARWYADCRAARLRLVEAYSVEHVGDRAQVLTLRVEDRPVTTLSVAVARTGAIVTSTVLSTTGDRPPHAAQVVGSLVDAVGNLCDSTVAGRCVGRPTYTSVPAPSPGPGEVPGLLTAADLPPVGTVDRPWVGAPATSGRRAVRHPSVTACDGGDLSGARPVRSRTYLIPGAALPDRFGLSETAGTFRTEQAAAAFVARVRAGLRTCPRRALSTRVSAERRTSRGLPVVHTSSWLLHVTVGADEQVRLRVGLVRRGRSVAQLTFTPAPHAGLSPAAFAAVLDRAGDRLRLLR